MDQTKKDQRYIYFEFGNGTVVKGVYSEHEDLLVNGVATDLWNKAKEAKAPNGSTEIWHVSCSDTFTSKTHGFGWSDKNWPDYDAAGDNPGWNVVFYLIAKWDEKAFEYESSDKCTGGVSTPTTTTTVAGPDPTTTTTTTTTLSTTTTAVGDTTTTTAAASPGDPELPDTGPGEMLAVLLGGLGLLLMGSGSLVITGARRQTLV